MQSIMVGVELLVPPGSPPEEANASYNIDYKHNMLTNITSTSYKTLLVMSMYSLLVNTCRANVYTVLCRKGLSSN